MRTQALLAVVILGSSVLACGSKIDPPAESILADTGAPPPGDASTDTADSEGETAVETSLPPTEERTCKRLADAMCGTATESCCTKLGITWAAGGCREAAMGYCTNMIDQVTLGRATYDDSKLEECAKSWESSITTCQSEFIPYLRSSMACAQLFNGTKAPGAACTGTTSAECMAPVGAVAYCDQAAKRCRVSTIAAEGSPCNFTGSTLRYCDEGLYCDLTGATAACKKQLAVGAACSTNNYIACGYSHTCVDGKCGVGLAAGEACTEAHQCSSWNCNAGTCNSVLYPMVDKGLCNANTAG